MGNIDLIIICREKAKSNTIVYLMHLFVEKLASDARNSMFED